MNNFTDAMSFIISLSKLTTKLTKKIERSLSAHGISFTEFIVMHHLDEDPHGVMRRIDLAERVGLTASGVTRLLTPMEKIGLVQKEKNPRDARVSLVKLSSAGKKVLADASISFEHGANNLRRRLSDNQLTQFIDLAKALN